MKEPFLRGGNKMLNKLIGFIQTSGIINDKKQLSKAVAAEFRCVKDRSVFYTYDFAIHFCQAESDSFSNCVISLSKLQKYDNKPFIVCLCTPVKNTIIQPHWAGRNSRGVSKFNGEAVKNIILNEHNSIDIQAAKEFLQRIIGL